MAKRSTGWHREFDDPIALPGGRTLITLRDAASCITALPKKEADAPEWQAAIEALMLVRSRITHVIRFPDAARRLLVLRRNEAGKDRTCGGMLNEPRGQAAGRVPSSFAHGAPGANRFCMSMQR
jgi:hypothetical protein